MFCPPAAAAPSVWLESTEIAELVSDLHSNRFASGVTVDPEAVAGEAPFKQRFTWPFGGGVATVRASARRRAPAAKASSKALGVEWFS